MKIKYITVLFAWLLICAPVLALADEDQARKEAGSSEGTQGMQGEMKKIAARVNGVDITTGSVIRMMQQMGSNENRPQTTAKEISALREEAIKRLVFQELVYQKAKAAGLTSDPATIDEAIASLKQKLGDEAAYKSFLENEKITEEELRLEADRSLTLQRMYEKEVAEKTTVSEEEMKALYEKHKDKFVRPEKMTVVDVVFFLKLDDPASLKKAEEVLKSMGEEKDPWNLVSDGTFVVRDLVIDKEKEPELYNAGKGLKTDELSGVVRTHDSLHIIKLKEYIEEKKFTFEEMRGALKMKLKAPVQKKRLDEWEKELRKDAKIEIFEPSESGSPTTGAGTKK